MKNKKMQVRLKAKEEEGPGRKKKVRTFKKATEAVRGDVNATLAAREDWEEGTWEENVARLSGVAEEKIEEERRRPANRGVWSEETEWWFWFGGDMLKAGAVEAAAEANKQLKKAKRRDERREVLESVAGELDIRDKWLGIRWMKKQFSQKSYCRTDEQGRHIPRENKRRPAQRFWKNTYGVVQSRHRKDRKYGQKRNIHKFMKK